MIQPPPIIIPRRKVSRTGDVIERQDFAFDLNKQSIADIQHVMHWIAERDTKEQIRAKNLPSAILADNKNQKTFKDAQRKIEVIFGNKLIQDVMDTIEAALLHAILESTTPRTRALRDLKHAWEWRYLKVGESPRIIKKANDVGVFGYSDAVILKPKRNYFTIVNNVVAKHGSIGMEIKASKKGARGRPRSARTLRMGFFGLASNIAKRNPLFTNYTIRAGQSRKYKLAGEESQWGTGYIIIKNKKRTRSYSSLSTYR